MSRPQRWSMAMRPGRAKNPGKPDMSREKRSTEVVQGEKAATAAAKLATTVKSRPSKRRQPRVRLRNSPSAFRVLLPTLLTTIHDHIDTDESGSDACKQPDWDDFGAEGEAPKKKVVAKKAKGDIQKAIAAAHEPVVEAGRKRKASESEPVPKDAKKCAALPGGIRKDCMQASTTVSASGSDVIDGCAEPEAEDDESDADGGTFSIGRLSFHCRIPLLTRLCSPIILDGIVPMTEESYVDRKTVFAPKLKKSSIAQESLPTEYRPEGYLDIDDIIVLWNSLFPDLQVNLYDREAEIIFNLAEDALANHVHGLAATAVKAVQPQLSTQQHLREARRREQHPAGHRANRADAMAWAAAFGPVGPQSMSFAVTDACDQGILKKILADAADNPRTV
uniref:Uncharacterized protein n=1 Tax=Mycena chlorophos TaxID=658473 RepID=A0ABQ0LM74_MYCCL|nr:predicted protein [Mycena chlorophos]